MADKNVTITTPVANNVNTIHIDIDGAGVVVSLTGVVSVTTNDTSTYHLNGFTFDVGSLPAAVQTAVDTLVTESLAEFKTEHGF